jgi:Flp pilus assembly protein TadG
MTTRTPRRRRQGGQALVVLALVGMVMLSFGAYAVDQGMSMSDRRTLQAVADSAALAGARSLSSGASTANYVAMQYLARSLGFTVPATCNGASCPAGGYTPTGSGYTLTLADGTTTLDVSVSHSRRAMLAGVMGMSTAVTGSGSRASTSQSTVGSACVVCLLDPSASGALSVTGSGGLSITGGNLAVDSTSATAATITGSGSISTSGSNRVVGGYQVTGSGGFSPAPSTGATTVSDPLSGLTPPTVVGTASSYSLTGSGSATISAGMYSSISATGSGTLTLNPGIYVLTGKMSVTGSGSITGSGVLLFFGCSLYPVPCTSSQKGGRLSQTGSGGFQLAAPTASTCTSVPATCPYQGLLVYYDPNNAAAMSITGSGSGPTGTIYAKSSTLTLSGSGGSVNSLIDVDRMSFAGSGGVTLTYQSSQNYGTSSSGGGLVR